MKHAMNVFKRHKVNEKEGEQSRFHSLKKRNRRKISANLKSVELPNLLSAN